MNYETVIGLEIHVQLKTKSKMFCSCSNRGEHEPPNTTVCPICMGHPGTLPVPNKEALLFAIKAAKALNCTIAAQSKFDRKHYFYPDLPKAYQISQYDQPVGEHGYIDIEVPDQTPSHMRVRIHRLHSEEDAAKNVHDVGGKTLVDFNRSGTPLIEIVSEADMRSPEQAKAYLQELRTIMRTLGVSDADMEKGHLRCDANISLRPEGDPELYPKTEIKNINSFRAVERALRYEQGRQLELWKKGTPIMQQSTRGWDDETQTTVEQRIKENAMDYRYFPEPDIPPLNLAELEKEVDLPELPSAKRARFIEELCFPAADARLLTEDPAWADFAERSMTELLAWLTATPGHSKEHPEERGRLGKLTAGWMTSKLMGLMADQAIDIRVLKITPENFAEFITLVHTGKINSTNALKLLGFMMEAGEDPSQIMEEKQLGQVDDASLIEEAIARVMSANPSEVERYRAGKKELLQFFVGNVMKETEGKANPDTARKLLEKHLG